MPQRRCCPAVVVECVRRAVADARDAAALRPGRRVATDVSAATPRRACAARTAQLLGPVINATGVLLHTNLGRAPLGADAIDAMARRRGLHEPRVPAAPTASAARATNTRPRCSRVACGAEAGIVVNNNAAAVLLVLATLARDREVIVSRGELVEIGGGFRVPEIMAETGARLVEVGHDEPHAPRRLRARDHRRHGARC